MINLMIKKLIFCLVLILPLTSISAFEKEKEFKSLMKNYLIGLNTKDKSKLKEVCSKKYMDLLQSNGTLKETFKKQKLVPPEKIDFDIKVQKAARTPNKFFVNIKDKKDDHYGEHWYVVNLKEKKYVIDDMVFRD